MIDTIVLRIHNVKKYEKTYNYFFDAKKSAITTAYVDENTGEYFENRAHLATVFSDTLRSIPLVHRSTIFLPSSHYSVSYCINSTRDYFEFNFSIPKYIWSTNLMQFISYYDESPTGTWTLLHKFLEDFFKTVFPEKIIPEDVEIHRLDICYNQFFPTKENALEYLEHQKDLVRKYARSDYNTYRPATYRTSWELITKRYKFKCYHKGTEFQLHDYKELIKDKNSNPHNLDLQFLQDNADRILRYELTLRHTYFNYLFQKIYFETDTRSDYYNYGDSRYRSIFRQCFEAGLKFKGKTELERYFGRTKHFMLSSVLDYSDNPITILQASHVTFNRTFWNCCYDKFFDMLHKFQLNRLLSVHEVAKKVDDMNETARLKNSLRRGFGKEKDKPRLIAYAMLAQYVPVDDLKGYMNKRTFLRMKADLKELGIGDTSRLSSLSMPEPRTDYWDYKVTFGSYHFKYV